MKTYTYKIDNINAINQIDFATFRNHDNILVQIFCGHDNLFLKQITNTIRQMLPHAECIGTTTDGEIEQDCVYTRHTIVAISQFDHTSLRGASISTGDSYNDGMEIARKLIGDNTKLLILFSDGTSTNGEEMLKGIEYIDSDIVIAGGMAGDNGEFVQTYVSYNSQIYSEGVVGIALDSDLLYVYNDFSFNWSPIGVEHIIDHAEDNRIYSIDGMNPVEFYAKYLGEQVADALPATGIEFPLIVEKNGVRLARAVIAKNEDNSLTFAGNLSSGDKVRLGFGNAKMILRGLLGPEEYVRQYAMESFFVYSCMARRRYMPDFIQVEISPFADIATTAGFFTYGEFYHHENYNALLNQTFTVVGLSESVEITESKSTKHKNRHSVQGDYNTTIEALTHLIDKSTVDYERQARELEKQKQYSNYLLEAQKDFLRHTIHETNTPLSVIMANIELFELEFGKQINLTNIEVATKSIHSIYEDLSYLVKKEHIDYPKKKICLVDYLRSRIDFFDVFAQRSDVNIEFDTDSNSIYVDINETKLQRIIDNNLSNAIKYTKKGRTIKVSIYHKNSRVVLQIISYSGLIRDIESIFEAYYRESRLDNGLGLGLNLVKQICDEEDILINVESNEKYTIFCYHFPKEDR